MDSCLSASNWAICDSVNVGSFVFSVASIGSVLLGVGVLVRCTLAVLGAPRCIPQDAGAREADLRVLLGWVPHLETSQAWLVGLVETPLTLPAERGCAPGSRPVVVHESLVHVAHCANSRRRRVSSAT